jgi:hypothetical protein
VYVQSKPDSTCPKNSCQKFNCGRSIKLKLLASKWVRSVQEQRKVDMKKQSYNGWSCRFARGSFTRAMGSKRHHNYSPEGHDSCLGHGILRSFPTTKKKTIHRSCRLYGSRGLLLASFPSLGSYFACVTHLSSPILAFHGKAKHAVTKWNGPPFAREISMLSRRTRPRWRDDFVAATSDWWDCQPNATPATVNKNGPAAPVCQ